MAFAGIGPDLKPKTLSDLVLNQVPPHGLLFPSLFAHGSPAFVRPHHNVAGLLFWLPN